MRILHVFRSPVGGLFRHVRDLAKAQSQGDHHVGLFCDRADGGSLGEKLLAESAAYCMGGVTTHPIARLPGPSDLGAIAACIRVGRSGNFDVLHGHGAKGGLLARLVAKRLGIPAFYTPHGGSLHFAWKSPSGAAFLAAEKIMSHLGSGFVFVCEFERQAFARKIGLAGKPSIVAHNGLWPEEFKTVVPNTNATDLLFVGEVRHLKGIDLLFDAMVQLRSRHKLSLTVVGDGPDLETYKALAAKLGLAEAVRFMGRLSIDQALPLGRIMIVPSRHESFPYVVLEAAAAGVPLIATAVGGIPEVLPPEMLATPDSQSLAARIAEYLAAPAETVARAKQLSKALKTRFSVHHMAETITGFYTRTLR